MFRLLFDSANRGKNLRLRVSLIILAISSMLLLPLSGCRWARESLPEGAFATSGNTDCLPNVTLTDQHGRPVSLASLKGKPVLVDFIYTSCPGPCLVLTSRMANVARRLGDDLGSKVTLVSITVDPEHDGPKQLLYYAKHQNADRGGWFFLTGTPKQIDGVMANFKLIRQRETDGSVDHITEFFLLGPDGRERMVFDPIEVQPGNIAAHLERTAAHG